MYNEKALIRTLRNELKGPVGALGYSPRGEASFVKHVGKLTRCFGFAATHTATGHEVTPLVYLRDEREIYVLAALLNSPPKYVREMHTFATTLAFVRGEPVKYQVTRPEDVTDLVTSFLGYLPDIDRFLDQFPDGAAVLGALRENSQRGGTRFDITNARYHAYAVLIMAWLYAPKEVANRVIEETVSSGDAHNIAFAHAMIARFPNGIADVPP